MKRRGRWFYGLILIAIALLLILSQLGLITATIGIWSILMGVLAAAMLVHGIAERSFFEIFCALGIALVTFDEVLSLPNISVWIVILVVILLSAGFECIFPKRKRTNHHRNNDEKWQPYEDENQTGEYQQVREENRDGHIYCCNRFGAAAKYISSDDLKGAELENSFGELKAEGFAKVRWAEPIWDTTCWHLNVWRHQPGREPFRFFSREPAETAVLQPQCLSPAAQFSFLRLLLQ